MFVKRDETGVISAVSRESMVGFEEQLPADHPDLLAYVHALRPDVEQTLEASDLQMARVLEDVINVLMDKGILRFTDLPEAAQKKLMHRREIRGRFNAVDLLDEDDDIGL